MNEDYKFTLLLTNNSKFPSETQAHDFLHYLNMLLKKNLDKKCLLFLDCLVEHHKTFCLKDNCPSRKQFVKTKQLAKIFQEEVEDANRIQLFYLIETMYLSAIERYPLK